MKLRCIDGKVRHFDISKTQSWGDAFISGKQNTDTICLECGLNFGVHDMKAIKPELKSHICILRESK